MRQFNKLAERCSFATSCRRISTETPSVSFPAWLAQRLQIHNLIRVRQSPRKVAGLHSSLFRVPMPKSARKVTSLVALISAAFLAAVWACSTIAIVLGSVQIDSHRPRTLSTSADIDSTWRHTKFGWQDSASWPAADSFVPIKTIELLHPVVWAGIVLIAVITTMIWASSEWEIARLFERDEELPT